MSAVVEVKQIETILNVSNEDIRMEDFQRLSLEMKVNSLSI